MCSAPATMKVALTNVCGLDHAIAFTNRALARKKAKEIKDDRKDIKARKDKIKPLSKWLSEAQAIFNAYIRARDSALPCISCGAIKAGQWDCSHYRSRGAASHLRFSEANCHRACSVCNQHFSGRIIDYRLGLIRKIGLPAVEALENDHSTKKWSIDECKFIKAHYSALTRALIKLGH